MYTDEYEKLHAEFMQSIVDYHNLYISYIHGSKGRNKNLAMRLSLKKVRDLSIAMIRESLEIKAARKELFKDAYQHQRTHGGDASRFHKGKKNE
jgi:hypothetical protein